ncbi:MAG: D-Ala-D-Ala carboxypeptidase family metallohydrolase [Nitrospiraceae bacterium]|nr:D-Ala-D-Ala carboxypeptidase family metallohydrolase [Nitrospiraceae bacterium]
MTEFEKYRCKHFQIYELVDKRTFDEFGTKAWELFKEPALIALDGIREFFAAPVTINNWWNGIGSFQFRGFRPAWYQGGATHSQHRLGNAFDFAVKGLSAEQVRQRIIENKDHELLKNIMRLEAAVNWVHFDCKPVELRIEVFHA